MTPCFPHSVQGVHKVEAPGNIKQYIAVIRFNYTYSIHTIHSHNWTNEFHNKHLVPYLIDHLNSEAQGHDTPVV